VDLGALYGFSRAHRIVRYRSLGGLSNPLISNFATTSDRLRTILRQPVGSG